MKKMIISGWLAVCCVFCHAAQKHTPFGEVRTGNTNLVVISERAAPQRHARFALEQSGCHQLEAPVNDRDDGTFTVIYTAKMKDQGFWAVGNCTLGWEAK